MNIGLDYDGCASNDPNTFAKLILLLEHAGHSVYMVTMRYPSELASVHPALLATGIEVFATSRRAKKPFMDAKGINIHVWIDDNPKAIHMDANQIWPIDAPEGSPVDVIHN